MITIIFGIASLLILVPIIYFLPIKMSLKGKWSILLIAFIFATIGLISQSVFLLWQTILLLLLLVGLASVILVRRFDDSSFSQRVIEKDRISKKNNLYKIENSFLTKFEEKSPLEDREIILVDEGESIQEDNKFIQEIEKESVHELESIQNHLGGVEKNLLNSIPDEDKQFFEIDEDSSFFLNREENFHPKGDIEDVFAAENNDTKQEIGYMSEIEKLLEETDIVDVEKRVYTQIENLEEMDKLEEIFIENDNAETEIAEEETVISDEEVEIEELVFQK